MQELTRPAHELQQLQNCSWRSCERCAMRNRAPGRIAAFDSTGHRRAADLALSELTGFARRALDDAAVHLAHAAVLKLSDQASYGPAQALL